ncbi:hypothetical protein KUF71_014766 [Frankliniella fusca]|uniref:Uncharacterized protein n=1 Tax=Frankliniella fusca TaxID=407009 RepID=A0AAE1I3Q9_9NEOP|nr:hypothetical protein KUF71_014766 [Frankliniella fusca]
MEHPKKDCIGPTKEEVSRCDPLDKVPPEPERPFVRCLRENQLPGEAVDRRFVDTRWILCSDSSTAPDHFLTTHQRTYRTPGACPRPGAARARLLHHYLLHQHALRVGQEALAPPPVEPYESEYSGAFAREFTPALEAELTSPDTDTAEEEAARHPLYSEPACSYWYQKQMLPPRGAAWDGVTARGRHEVTQPFRRNALFSTPVHLSLHEAAPVEAPRPPRLTRSVNHHVLAPYNTPVM